MPLTDVTIRNAKPGEKTVKLFDERGLYLEISSTGGKWWRFKYRFDGKEKRLSLGVYPDVSLKDARDRRDAARKLLADGIGRNQSSAPLVQATSRSRV
ncbi:MAG TPA: Arm DNA-binding domain-containing protein, partial [Polyangiaceae bacterium]|nr:Arm DNA-binding domain-containing protein [Polyangiaceae bacterium]